MRFSRHLLPFLAAGLVFLFSNRLQAQEEQSVRQTVLHFLDAVVLHDTAAMQALMHPSGSLMTVTDGGKVQVLRKEELIRGLAQGRPMPDAREVLLTEQIRVDSFLANMVCAYHFVIGKQVAHGGTDVFTLGKVNGRWQILHVADTRHPYAPAKDREQEVNEFLNAWHRAAATADEDVFFGSMSEDGVYIGTDASERWLRDEMKVWAEKYFQKESAWAFTPIERKVYFDKSGTHAWFNETLDTWMGVCRGSGVLTLEGKDWRIRQYHLSVTVPNELVQGFIELVKKGSRE